MRTRALSSLGTAGLLLLSLTLSACGDSGFLRDQGGALEVRQLGRRRPGLRARRGRPAGGPRGRQAAADRRQHHPGGQRRRRGRTAARGAQQGVGGARHRQADRAQQGDRHRPQDLAQRREGVRGVGGSGATDSPVAPARSSSAAPTSPRTSTLANIYAEVLEGRRLPGQREDVGNRELYEPALEKGEIQVMPEYAGTLTEFINKAENGADAEPLASGDLDATVQALTELGEHGRPDVRRAVQRGRPERVRGDHGVRRPVRRPTLSDLGSKCSSGLVLGGPPECPERPFCQPGLEDTYGLTFDSFTSLDAGGPLSKTALKQGKVDGSAWCSAPTRPSPPADRLDCCVDPAGAQVSAGSCSGYSSPTGSGTASVLPGGASGQTQAGRRRRTGCRRSSGRRPGCADRSRGRRRRRGRRP